MIRINEFLQKFETPFLNVFFNIVTLLGSVIGIVFFYFIILIFYDVKKSKLYLVTILIFFIVITILKNILKIPRPFTFGSIYNLDYELTEKLNPNHSTPSGHSYVASYSVFFILFNFKLKYFKKLFYFILLFLVMLSRIYLGVHSILDVLLGASIGFLANYILYYYKLLKKIKFKYSTYLLPFIFLLAFIILAKNKVAKNNLILIVTIILTPISNIIISENKLNLKYLEKIFLLSISILPTIIFYENPKYDINLFNIFPVIILNYLIYTNFYIFNNLKNDIININKRRQIKWKN